MVGVKNPEIDIVLSSKSWQRLGLGAFWCPKPARLLPIDVLSYILLTDNFAVDKVAFMLVMH